MAGVLHADAAPWSAHEGTGVLCRADEGPHEYESSCQQTK